MLKDFMQLTIAQQYVAYTMITSRFQLDSVESAALQASPEFKRILFAAHNGMWATVELQMEKAGII
jgi:hypothetical protein